MRRTLSAVLGSLLVVPFACGEGSNPTGGAEAGVDVGVEAGADARMDVGPPSLGDGAATDALGGGDQSPEVASADDSSDADGAVVVDSAVPDAGVDANLANRDMAAVDVGRGDTATMVDGVSCTGVFVLGTVPASPVGENPNALVAADLNGDGNEDLAVANYGAGSVSILLGKGDQTFAPKVDYACGSKPASLALGDLDGDGKLDLVTANAGKNTVSVLRGNGDGSFAAQVEYVVLPVGYTGQIHPASVALGDVNGDRRLDIVTANTARDGTVTVLLGKADGGFAPQVNYPVGDSPVSVALGDLNADGNLDIVEANYLQGFVGVLLGEGDGSFATMVKLTTTQMPYSVLLGDVNDDKRLDIVSVNTGVYDGTISVLLGNGDGTFATKNDYTILQRWITDSPALYDPPIAAVLADVDGDGNLDFVNGTTVMLGTGDGRFVTVSGELSSYHPPAIALGDFNNDGHPDLAAASYDDDLVSAWPSACR